MAQLAVETQNSLMSGVPGTADGELVGRNSTTKVGFFGTTPISKPTIPASPTAEQIAAVLVALGLANQGT